MRVEHPYFGKKGSPLSLHPQSLETEEGLLFKKFLVNLGRAIHIELAK